MHFVLLTGVDREGKARRPHGRSEDVQPISAEVCVQRVFKPGGGGGKAQNTVHQHVLLYYYTAVEHDERVTKYRLRRVKGVRALPEGQSTLTTKTTMPSMAGIAHTLMYE